MSLWTFIKIIAGLGVAGVMAFTGMFAWHIMVAPLDGVFEELVPAPANPLTSPTDSEVAELLVNNDIGEADPGEKVFQRAHELLAMGHTPEALEKLTTIVNIYPTSSCAPVARQIVGEINLDEIFATSHMDGKSLHVVKPGDSFFGIAAKYDTTLDCMMALNSMMELGGLHPGDELLVMPLNFRFLLEPKRHALSVWKDGRFIREYIIAGIGEGVPTASKAAKISSKFAEFKGSNVNTTSTHYRAADKIIQFEHPSLQLRATADDDNPLPGCVLLQPHDMEEINLLARVGNVMEIR
ncbi:MAG: LysM peptidoglycan-binding domain-containing protein [Verrucomicrobiales bacterium]|nr:LysM domain-containing protein [Verrucomicrobiota bacterium JB025]